MSRVNRVALGHRVRVGERGERGQQVRLARKGLRVNRVTGASRATGAARSAGRGCYARSSGAARETGAQGPPGETGAQGPQGPAGKDAIDLAAVYQQVVASVVCVDITTNESEYLCATGFYIDDAGTVLTAAHAVEFEGETVTGIDIIAQDGSHTKYRTHRTIAALDAVLLVP